MVPLPAMTPATVTPDPARLGIRADRLACALLCVLAGHGLLLWRFLGVGGPAALLAGGIGIVALATLLLRPAGGIIAPRIAPATLAACIVVAALLLMLGGEGRFVYANADWQVRDAVLRDMGRFAWPFAYPGADGDRILRAPLGMYLVPALAAHVAGQRGGDLMLLAQNAGLLGSVLALGSVLFPTRRARAWALGVAIAFSGLDIVGTLMVRALGIPAGLDHLENWGGLQYSSHVTLAFWVPQHAFAGWLCAMLYLLWRDGRLPLAPFLASVPLAALWSPLAIMGVVPFAGLAAGQAIRARRLRIADVAAPAVALGLALPSLLYLRAGAAAVHGGVVPVAPVSLGFTLLLEVMPFALPVAIAAWRQRFAGTTLLLAVACLALMPLYRIGSGQDFQLRASIMPLAVLAACVADMVALPGAASRGRRGFLLCMLAIGAVTGLAELRRALSYRPSPVTRCSLIGSWDQQTGLVVDKATYLAPATSLPAMLRAAPAERVPVATDPASCWDRRWRSPSVLGKVAPWALSPEKTVRLPVVGGSRETH